MRESDLIYLVCPICAGDLVIDSADDREGQVLMNARLECAVCRAAYPVVRGVPRFVPNENYASSFGLEWTMHARTQYDSYTGLSLSEKRFFEETRWPRHLPGQIVLEVGSGSGRFTEQAASTGAFIVSMDYSAAVEANFESNGAKPNVLVVQGDVYHMPFPRSSFDKLFCFGMLQHTPDVHRAFMALSPMLKPGGELVVDVYRKNLIGSFLQTKNYVRPLTRNMSPERLYRLTTKWVDAMWPLSRAFGKIPRIGHSINWRLLVADYSFAGVTGDLLKEWAYLDTFDMLSPRYDSPQALSTMRKWFGGAGLTDVEVTKGYNGIEARGKKPVGRPLRQGFTTPHSEEAAHGHTLSTA